MLSFSSTLNVGGKKNRIKEKYSGDDVNGKVSALSAYQGKYDIGALKAYDLIINSSTKQRLLSPTYVDITQTDISSTEGSRHVVTHIHPNANNASADTGSKVKYENPYTMSAPILRVMNNYRWVYANPVVSITDAGKGADGKSPEYLLSNTASAVSLFNPIYSVQVKGFTSNVPLLNDLDSDASVTVSSTPDNADSKNAASFKVGFKYDSNLTDCSISELVSLSQNANSILGTARYRYADFMYCKDLGKVSNNHLITLRRFAHPIGDNIFETSSPMFHNKGGYGNQDTTGDIGRLVTWFGTDDNKLEDILKFNFKSSWKEFNAEIQQRDSEEDDKARGPVGWLANTFSSSYRASAAQGFVQTNSLGGWLGSKFSQYVPHAGDTSNSEWRDAHLKNYDKNKIYEPKNTIRKNNFYEGNLEFENSFTLNFKYKLRAYDNINPKSAFLDLIGNVLATTYTAGHFWGGQRRIIGPTTNTAPYAKASAIVDNAFEKIGGLFDAFASGVSFTDIMQQIGSDAANMVSAANDTAKAAVSGAGGAAAIAKGVIGKGAKMALGPMRGALKNALGRPAMYMMDSLVSGADTGLWHLTVGNPKNPIVAMGNLKVDSTTITQSGPLGLDDFPTELNVSVELSHCRPRDSVAIGNMYTKGLGSLYAGKARSGLAKFISISDDNGSFKTYEDSYDKTAVYATETSANTVAASQSENEMKNESYLQKLGAGKFTDSGLVYSGKDWSSKAFSMSDYGTQAKIIAQTNSITPHEALIANDNLVING